MSSGGCVSAIRRVGFTTADLSRTATFYAGLGFSLAGTESVSSDDLAVLGLPRSRADRLVMRLGRQEVEFLQFDAPGRPYPEDSTSTDLWFQHIAIVVADMAQAFRSLADISFRPISAGGPQRLPQNTGGVSAFKFRDPDGHPLELLHFPPGTGDPAWQVEGADSPFLGIDHTAIAVGDADRSRGFYEGLGFRRGAHSLNRGAEQQRLDDVVPDVVDVIALEPERKTPHLELLAYRTGTRRPLPQDGRADDIAATRTIVTVRSLPTVQSGDAAGSGRRGPVLLSDPDGHMLVAEPEPDGGLAKL